jgi:hypothetical protein
MRIANSPSGLKIRYRRISTFCLFCVFCSAPAHATYDKKCIDLLSRTETQDEAFMNWRRSWEIAIHDVLGVVRPISNIEYEVYMDITHGLPLIATFSNGQKIKMWSPKNAFKQIRALEGRAHIVDVQYMPQSLKKLGEIYKRACLLVGRHKCFVYDDYPGLSGADRRPFTPLEEQAIKWSTFHMAPANQIVSSYRKLRRPESEIKTLHDQMENMRQHSAQAIIVSVFEEEEIRTLYTHLVSPFIRAAFERVYMAYTGLKVH